MPRRLGFLGLLAGLLGCGPAVGAGGRPDLAPAEEGGAGGSGGSGGVVGVSPLPETDCENGRDDDGDGALDCDDADCQPDLRLARGLADPDARFVRGAGGEALILHLGRGSTASVRNFEALVVDARGASLVAMPEDVFRSTSATNFEATAIPGGGYAAVFNPVGTGGLELVVLDRRGAVISTATLDETASSRPLISFAADPRGAGLAILRTVGAASMELGWFALDGTVLEAWRPFAVLEHRTARLLTSGDHVRVLHLPNFDDDAIRGRMWWIEPGRYGGVRDTAAMRAHCAPLVPRDGELVFLCNGTDQLEDGGQVTGPELTRVSDTSATLARMEPPHPDDAEQRPVFAGAWDGGFGIVYADVIGSPGLLVARISWDLAEAAPIEPLLPGLPTVIALSSTAEEDLVFYVTERDHDLRVKSRPAFCRP